MNIKASKLSVWFKYMLTFISPRLNTEVNYFIKFGKRLNLKAPTTLDEKIQWLKFNTYYKNPLVTQCADKYRVREYVKERGCGDILITTLGEYDHANEIDWDNLPDQFVAKWNFGCGQNLICRDKKSMDKAEAIKKLNQWGKETNGYMAYSEMHYKDIVPKIIVERMILGENGALPEDYKVYCFNGHPEYVMICHGRDVNGHGAKYYFFDKKWQLARINKDSQQAPDNFTLPKPDGFDHMLECASKLSEPFPFVRADFYIENGKVYFGELTFTPCGGMDTNRLPSTQILFGNMLQLPSV